MQLLVAADLHYNLPHFDWLVTQAPTVDVVALPGDHLDVTGSVPIAAQAVVVARYLQRLATHTTVLATSGNHDLDGPGEHGEQVPAWLQHSRADGVHVDGETLDIEDVRFTLCPWWDGPIARAAVDAQLARDAIDRPRRWIWLYHSPPEGTPLCWTGKRAFPDPDLRAWIELHQPNLVFTGHIHQAPWVPGGGWTATIGRTRVFNAGRGTAAMPSHLFVDTDSGVAEWYGFPERDQVTLW